MRVYLLAGEASGDQLGAALMDGLKALSPEVAFDGVGGPLMQDAGMRSLFPMSDLSVMGLTEVLPRYPALRRRLHEAANDIVQKRPDVLITIDSPDFSFRLARLVKERMDMPVVHYVAPSVWAWRPKRAAKMAKVVDHVLALLPFESPYMTAVGMTCDFVGHPVSTLPVPSEAEIGRMRERTGLGDSPYLAILPGSRRSEISRHLPVFEDVVRRVLERHPEFRVVLPTTGHLSPDILAATEDWPGRPLVLGPDDISQVEKLAVFKGANAALAASGTVSLELAAVATPMVIAYRTSWLTWQIMSRLVRLDTVTLINLVTETRVIPEFLGPDCQADKIAVALSDVLENDERRAAQIKAMNDAMTALGRGGSASGHRAARSVLTFLSNRDAGRQ